MMVKRAQMGVFISMVVLVIALVTYALFSKLSASRYAVEQTENAITDYQKLFTSTGSVAFFYTTVERRTLHELLGSYVCYEREVNANGINIPKALSQRFNMAFGKGRWALDIEGLNNKRFCLYDGQILPHKCEYEGIFERKSFNFIFPACAAYPGTFKTGVFHFWTSPKGKVKP